MRPATSEHDPDQKAAALAAFDLGHRRWPGTRLELGRFVSWLETVAVRLSDLSPRAEDLVLACACGTRDRAAIGHFEREHLRMVPKYVSRAGMDDARVDEVVQKVRLKLLMGQSPGIAGYNGSGPLGGFVRVTAVRVARDVAASTAGSEEQARGSLLAFDALSSQESPEVQYVRSHDRREFERAFTESLLALSTRDQALLRMQFLDSLSLDAMAVAHGVHRATVARWSASLRARLHRDLSRRLALHLSESGYEARTLVALLSQDPGLDVEQLLAA